MMDDWRSLQVNIGPLNAGKFHDVLVDSEGNTVLIQVMTIKKFDFENIEYFECPDEYDGHSSFNIWKKIKSNIDERFEDITSGCKVLKIKRDGKEYIAFETNNPITGYIQFG